MPTTSMQNIESKAKEWLADKDHIWYIVIAVIAIVGVIWLFGGSDKEEATANASTITLTMESYNELNDYVAKTAKAYNDMSAAYKELAGKEATKKAQLDQMLQQANYYKGLYEQSQKDLENTQYNAGLSSSSSAQYFSQYQLAQQQLRASNASEAGLSRQLKESRQETQDVQEKLDNLWSRLESVQDKTDPTTTSNLTASKRADFYEMWKLWYATLNN